MKRALCSEDVGFTPEDVFDGAFLDGDHISRLRQRLEERLRSHSHPRGAELLAVMERLEGALRADLDTPSLDDLCRRYSSGKLDARTVIQITGWTADELYDACSQRGLSPAT